MLFADYMQISQKFVQTSVDLSKWCIILKIKAVMADHMTKLALALTLARARALALV